MLEAELTEAAPGAIVERADQASPPRRDESEMPGDQLMACFQGLAGDFAKNIEFLTQYFSRHLFKLDYEVIGQFILPVYVDPNVTDEMRYLASRLLNVLVLQPGDLALWLTEHGFVECLAQLLPNGGSLMLLESMGRVSWAAAKAISKPEMLDALELLFSPETVNTALAFTVLSRWVVTEESLPKMVDVFRKVASIVTTTGNEHICVNGLFAIGVVGRDNYEIATTFFQCERAAQFMSTITNDTVFLMRTFLEFLDDVFSNEQYSSDRTFGAALYESIGPDVLKSLLDFIMIPLQSPNNDIIGLAGRVLSKLIFRQETVTYCFMQGFPAALFKLLDQAEDFKTKKELARALCALMASATVEQAGELFQLGFAEFLICYVDSLAMEIPFEVISALNGIIFLSETEHKSEWFALVFENDAIEDALAKLCTYNSVDREYLCAPHLTCGLLVCQPAQALYDRRYNFD